MFSKLSCSYSLFNKNLALWLFSVFVVFGFRSQVPKGSPRRYLWNWLSQIKSITPFIRECTTVTRLHKHNDKYIYKSVASLVQYISKDILSLQWPLSRERGRPFQFVILIMRIIVIIVMIKRILPVKPLKVHGHKSFSEQPRNSHPPTTPPPTWCCCF